PNKSLVVVDARGVVIAQPSPREWGSPSCLNVRFLDDTRVIVVWNDYVARKDCTVRKKPAKTVGGRRVVARNTTATNGDERTMAAALEIVDVDAKGACTFRRLRTFGFSHSPTRGGLGLTRDKKTAAVASTDGIVLVDVASGDERACVGGPPIDAYPAL